MRPHEPKKTATARGVAAVQMHIGDRLWWLAGYPHRRRWQFVPDSARAPELLTLDGRHLRRASYGLRKLRGEFPRALPRVVGDRRAWVAGVETIIKTLKAPVHGTGPAPRNLIDSGLYARPIVRAARAAPASLARLVDALSYVYATTPKRLGKALSWLEDARVPMVAVIDQRGLRRAIQLTHLATRLGPGPLEPLLAIAADDRIDGLALAGGDQTVDRLAKAMGTGQVGAFESPPARLAAEVDGWIDQLLARPPKVAKRFLRVLAATDLGALIDAWSRWWPPVSAAASKASNIARSYGTLVERMTALEDLRRRVVTAKKTIPVTLDPRALSASLGHIAESASGKLVTPTLALLEALGDGVVGGRCAMAVHIGLLTQPSYDREHARLPAVIRGLRDHVRRVGARENALAPWMTVARKEAASGRGWSGVSDELLDCDFPRDRIEVFFVALASLVESGDKPLSAAVTTQLAQRLTDLVPAEADPERAARLVTELHRGGEFETWRPTERYAAALSILGDDETHWVEIVRACDRVDDDCEVPIGRLFETLLPALAGSAPTLVAVLLGGDLSAIMTCGRRLSLLAALAQVRKRKAEAFALPASGSAEATAWIADYPPALHPSLRVLAVATEDAAAVASKLSRSVITPADALRRERDALTVKLASIDDPTARGRMQTRLANLERRIASPTPPSPAKLASLSLKIHRRAAQLLLAAVETPLRERLEAQLATLVGVEAAPAWMLRDDVMRVIGAALLERRCRAPLARLLEVRCQPPPWDLRDAPPNRAFLEGLEKRDIATEPWLGGFGPRRRGDMTLALEDDPLEIFYMGHHFNTCLSIGGCNFFSVFSNALDINKRVIYARDADNTVVGRRLVCISEDGGLVAFRAYAHTDNDFEKHSAAFIRDLAKRMNTHVAPRGTIATLVASDWYDDGSIDVVGRFEFLADGSAFRKALAKVEPDKLGALLAKTTGRGKVDALLAPMLLNLDEIHHRAELAVPLARLLAEPAALPAMTCMQMFEQLSAAGRLETAGRLFGSALEAHVRRAYRQHHRWLDRRALGLLAPVVPSRVLRLLRELRGRGERRWLDRDDELVIVAARCMARLHRRTQARRLLEAVIERTRESWARGLARDALAEI